MTDDTFDRAFADDAQDAAQPAEAEIEERQEPAPLRSETETPAPEPEQSEEQPAKEAETPAQSAEPEKPSWVPLEALEAERQARQELAERLARIEGQAAAYSAQQQQPKAPQPDKLPDIYEDPEGFAHAISQRLETQFEQQRVVDRFAFSERLARQQYGDEKVVEVHKWAADRCAQDPHFNAKVMSSVDPYGEAIRAYQEQQVFTQTGGDLEAYKQRIIEEYLQTQGLQQPVGSPDPQAKPTANLPPSVAGSGGAVRQAPAMSSQQVFEAAFV